MMYVLIANLLTMMWILVPYDISVESDARPNTIIEIINEQHEHFVSEMREFGLLRKTDSSPPIPRLESSRSL